VSDNGPPTGTGRDPWWDDVDAEITALADEAVGEPEREPDGRDLPDPWAAIAPDAGQLTAEQAAFLAGLGDQPGVPRLAGLGEDAHGPDVP
jgi:hypothetical protein